MKILSCETHIEQALDAFIEKVETFPVMEKIEEEKMLSTKCDYCDTSATYIVANA